MKLLKKNIRIIKTSLLFKILKYYIIATWKEKRYRIHRILVVRIPVIDMKYKQNETELIQIFPR